MKPGMQVDLGPGHTVLDGDPAPLAKDGHSSSQFFGPCLLWSNGWMDKMKLGMEVGLGPGVIVLDGDLPLPHKRTARLNFRSVCIMAERSPISATAELLLRYASGQTDRQTDIQRHADHNIPHPSGEESQNG